ncbi:MULTISPECIES: zinc-binding alcohol dehydrogenase family protein [unclassified Sinorhizobium]|uniref:quinone oxidoreductase family protein n=1 Tax=unclassified Sinorhizobium TaxID=2613772 RepID=UPI003524307E
MKAVQLNRFGGPDVLEIVDVPTPEPGQDEVLVRIHAAGVNFFEVLMRADRYAVTPELPMIPGVEVAGVVEQVGPGADETLLGARVAVPLFAIGISSGGYAEFIAVDGASVTRLPDGLSFEDAVALMVQGLTAFHLVRRSVPKGKSVMVNAAAGGVGSLLVQLAKDAGARRVIGAAGSQEKAALVLSLGADAVVDYSRPDWVDRVREASEGQGVDIVYETIGGSMSKASLTALAPCGELVFAALGRFELEKAELERMISGNQSLKGFALLPLLQGEEMAKSLGSLFEMAASGRLKILRGGRYRLQEAALAHDALECRRTIGKVVLVP